MPEFTSEELDMIEHCVNVVLDQMSEEADEFEKQIRIAENILGRLHGAMETYFKCPDCGEQGETRGHYGCQYPSDDPNIEGLDDPMERER